MEIIIFILLLIYFTGAYQAYRKLRYYHYAHIDVSDKQQITSILSSWFSELILPVHGEEIIVYKIVEKDEVTGRYVSIFANGDARVNYPLNERVTAPAWLAEQGNYLFAYKNIDALQTEWKSYSQYVILRCKVRLKDMRPPAYETKAPHTIHDDDSYTRPILNKYKHTPSRYLYVKSLIPVMVVYAN